MKTVEEMKNKYGEEEVLVVDKSVAELLSNKAEFSGISENSIDVLNREMRPIKRYLAEYNSTVKQVIPYGVISDVVKRRFFTTRRVGNSGDERIFGKIALGIGGHINPCDVGDDTVMRGLMREIEEEIILEHRNISGMEVKGIIHDEADSIGRDHIGVVIYIIVRNLNSVRVKEDDNLVGSFMYLEEIRSNYNGLERWSKIVHDNLLICD